MGERINVWIYRTKGRRWPLLQWHDENGARKSVTVRIDDPAALEKARADQEFRINNSLYEDRSTLTWAKFREIFEAEYLPGLRERSGEKYGTVFDVFEDECGPKKLRDVNERMVSRFLSKMRTRQRKNSKGKPTGKVGLSPMTMRNYLVCLRTAIAWAAKQKLISRCPDFPKVKVPKKKPQPVPAELYDRLIEAEPDPLWKAYMACGWWAGLRLSEAAALRWEASERYPWLNLEQDRIVLPAAFAKSAQDQWVPIHPSLRAILDAIPRSSSKVFPLRNKNTGAPMTRAGITNHVRWIAKNAGVRLSMHSLRKGFGCRVASKLGKGNAPVLHRLMRHSSMQLSMDYYASVDDVLHDSIKELSE